MKGITDGGTLIVVMIMLLIALITFSLFGSFNLSTGVGKQSGYISEVERTGILWRPPEVKLISIVPTYSEADTVWYYGANEQMAKLAEEYSKNNTKVIISYHQEHLVWNWEYSSTILIDSIEPIIE